MSRIVLIFRIVLALAMMPGTASACVYPTPLRVLNDTMIEAIERGGEVTIRARVRMGRILDNISADDLLRAISGEVSRRNLRAARNVMAAAAALADGRGLKIDPSLGEDTSRLKEAVRSTCSDATQGVTGTAPAKGVEFGGDRKEGSTGRGLTFQEGLIRLSVAFTIYLIFLVFLFVLRQILNARYPTVVPAATPMTTDAQDVRPPRSPPTPSRNAIGKL